MKHLIRATCAALCLALLAGGGAAAQLPEPIERVIRAHKLPHDTVSLLVQAVDADAPLLALNLDAPRNPASAVKLVTTWTALDLLGPTHTWPTRVYTLGPVENGVLKGDLLIKGYGDPYLVLEDFWKLAGEIRALGIRDVEGRLLIDDSRFALDPATSGDFDRQPWRGYNTLPNALLVNFQSIDFVFRPDPATNSLHIQTNPALPNLRITNEVKLTSGPCRGNAVTLVMNVPEPAVADHVVFSGKLPFTCRNYKLSRSLMTPASYAYGTFRMLWEQWGGTIKGDYALARVPKGSRPALTWRSRHLGEIIRPLNKWSNNVMTRMLLYAIAEAGHKPPVSRAQGAAVLLEHLESRGLDVTGVVIDNGSGLSRDTRVTAKFMGELLRLAWSEPTMPEYLASMAIAGKDGTMRKRFRGRAEAGRMHVKTGRLDNAAAVAGYVHAKSGQTFVVCMLVNHRNVHWGPGIELMEALLAWAYRQ